METKVAHTVIGLVCFRRHFRYAELSIASGKHGQESVLIKIPFK